MPNKEWENAPPTYRSRCHCIIVFLSFDSFVEDVDKSSEVLVGLLGGRGSGVSVVFGWRPPLAVGFIWDMRFFRRLQSQLPSHLRLIPDVQVRRFFYQPLWDSKLMRWLVLGSHLSELASYYGLRHYFHNKRACAEHPLTAHA